MTEMLRHIRVALPRETMAWVSEAAGRDGVTVAEWVAQISADEVAVARRAEQRRLLGDDDTREVLELAFGDAVAEELKRAALSAGVTISDWVGRAISGQAAKTHRRSMLSPRQRSGFEEHISSVLHDARRAEQAVYERVLSEAMAGVSAGLPALKWNCDPLSVVLGIHGIIDTGDLPDRCQAIRAWVDRYGSTDVDVTVEYHKAVVLRAVINVEGQRCILSAIIWDPEVDSGPRPRRGDVHAAANPHLPEPTLPQLIEEFTHLAEVVYNTKSRCPELDDLLVEITGRTDELSPPEKQVRDRLVVKYLERDGPLPATEL